MRSLIPPRYYYDPQWFAEEQERLFGSTWQLAGFAPDLAGDNDFVTTMVAGKSVVVQNFGGELRAFANVCSHRFARIHSECKGNGMLRCPYHGWIYNKEGIPYSIPSRPRFEGLTREVVEGLRLRPYAVEQCGALVFVRGGEEGPTLREYLADAWEPVEEMGAVIGDRIGTNEITFQANWKVAVENALESYHVGFVHQNTFKKLGTTGMDFRFAAQHSAWLAPADAATEAQMRKLASLYRSTYRMDGYFHQLVFPNLTAITLYGTSFGFHHFQPVGPTETRITSHLFLPRLGEGVKINASMAEMMNRSTAEFAASVFMEDKGVCEAVQNGLPESTLQGILSEEEERVWRFQEAYMAWVGEGVPA
ncbi:MAG: aromatic ring-hydroxylating dioxygenase subunit alpha [Gemmatimonadetes bacterium]|nr:aromatic ring-hydroxylating dioxygenase subunit alpha [Gemmatimonadota bacterium]